MFFPMRQRFRLYHRPSKTGIAIHASVNHGTSGTYKPVKLQSRSAETDNVACSATGYRFVRRLRPQHNTGPPALAVGIDFHPECHQFIAEFAACKGSKFGQRGGNLPFSGLLQAAAFHHPLIRILCVKYLPYIVFPELLLLLYLQDKLLFHDPAFPFCRHRQNRISGFHRRNIAIPCHRSNGSIRQLIRNICQFHLAPHVCQATGLRLEPFTGFSQKNGIVFHALQ